MAQYTISIFNCGAATPTVNACDTISWKSVDPAPGRSYTLTGNMISQNALRGVQGPISVPSGGTPTDPYIVIGVRNTYTYNINGSPNCTNLDDGLTTPEIIIEN